MQYKDVYEYIITEKTSYETSTIPLTDNWEWSMFEHIKRSFSLKNSKFSSGNNDNNRPFKNIIRPILNVQYRTEGFDVKDIVAFVNDAKNYYKSFLVKKFHPRWARANNIDTFIDELVESYVDYGLALVKNVNDVRPEVVPLQRLAFCDQTDILTGALCELHQYSPDQLREMAGKWNAEEIEFAINMAKDKKSVSLAKKDAKTPSKYVEVYELHGTLPATWLNKDDAVRKETDAYGIETEIDEREYTDENEYVSQMHIVTFYKAEDGNKKGICLFKSRERRPRYKAIKRDNVFGRACGFGGVEELFDAQTWVNYSEIQLKEMLDVASLILLQTADESYKTKNLLDDMEKGQVLTHEDNKPLTQITLTPQNKEKFDVNVTRWEQTARTIASANDPLLGESPTSGTPFKLQELVVQEGNGIHDYRKGKISTFVSEIYRDWVLPYYATDINKGQKFAEELTLDELQSIADTVVENMANDKAKQLVLDGKPISPQIIDQYKQEVRDNFMKGGNKRFLEIFKDEIKDLPIDVEMNIAGKQSDLAKNADKLTNIFRTVVANPQVLQAPGMAKLFNEIIEDSGFSPIDFSDFTRKVAPQEEQVVEDPAKAAELLPV